MRLTLAAIEGLKQDTGVADKIIFDDSGLRHSRARQRGPYVDLSVQRSEARPGGLSSGHAMAIKPARAREIAGELHAKVRLGRDPASEKRERVQRTLKTFGTVSERFLDQYKRRPRTKYEVERHLQKYAAPLHPAPFEAITLRDVADLLAKIDKASGPVTAGIQSAMVLMAQSSSC